MKKIFILTVTLLATATFSTVYTQVTPAGAGDKDLRDTNVKGRSNELERIDRDARKEAGKKKDKSAINPAAEQPEDKLAAKFSEINTDYERIQLSQNSVIEAYEKGEKINYEQISKSSLEINKSAIRLNSNLFPAPTIENPDAKKEEKTEKETKTSKSIRDLIVDLDDAVGSFAVSPMFQNLRKVNPTVSEQARLDLEKIIELSELLDAEAKKMSTTEK